MIRKLLVAVDFSEAAAAAVRAAERLALQVDGEIVLVHVIDANSYAKAHGIDRLQPTFADMQNAGNTLLRKHQASISRDVPVITQVLEGDPPEQIISAAVESCADMILIGTDSRGRLAHFLLGSTADTVIRYAPCPVLTVRADRKSGARVPTTQFVAEDVN